MVNGPCGLLADVHPDVAERDIFQAVALASVQENAVFAAAVNVFKMYIADIQTYKELSDFYDYSMKLLNQDNH